MYALLLIGMLFCHIVYDFGLQGILAHMKQKQWWVDNAPNPMYENDYKTALMLHALAWTCCIHIPIVFHIGYCDWHFEEIPFLIVFTVDWIIHTVVDDLKANKGRINLSQDQAIHIIQVIVTWALYFGLIM